MTTEDTVNEYLADPDPMTPADEERAADNTAADEHYGDDPLADCPHPVDGFVTVTVEGGRTPRRACGACWKDFGPVTDAGLPPMAGRGPFRIVGHDASSDQLPAPTGPALPMAMRQAVGEATEFQQALERIAGVLRDHAPILVTALTDELKSVRWQLEQEGLRKRQTERQLEIERREHAAAREAWAKQRQHLTDELNQRETDVLELLGYLDDAGTTQEVLAEFRARKAGQVDAERYELGVHPNRTLSEQQQRTRTMHLAGGDPDDHALSGS